MKKPASSADWVGAIAASCSVIAASAALAVSITSCRVSSNALQLQSSALQLLSARADPKLYVDVVRDSQARGEQWNLVLKNTGELPAVDVRIVFFRTDITDDEDNYVDLSQWIIKDYEDAQRQIRHVSPNDVQLHPLRYKYPRGDGRKLDLYYFARGDWDFQNLGQLRVSLNSRSGNDQQPVPGLVLYVSYSHYDDVQGDKAHYKVVFNAEGRVESRVPLGPDDDELKRLRERLGLM